MAAPEVPLRGASAQVKLRNPVNTALLSLIPFYALFWWYYVNKEMVELGRARGTDQLGDSPGTSVLALFHPDERGEVRAVPRRPHHRAGASVVLEHQRPHPACAGAGRRAGG